VVCARLLERRAQDGYRDVQDGEALHCEEGMLQRTSRRPCRSCLTGPRRWSRRLRRRLALIAGPALLDAAQRVTLLESVLQAWEGAVASVQSLTSWTVTFAVVPEARQHAHSHPVFRVTLEWSGGEVGSSVTVVAFGGGEGVTLLRCTWDVSAATVCFPPRR
jgi:uncharacterized protein (DUF736 family)